MNRKIITNVTITEPITLAELEWLVEQCRDMAPTSKVTITEHKSYTPMEFDVASVTVHGERP